MDKDLISVIIPVYNVAEYLDECISSVINQTYDNIEVILVDDGSDDGSAEVCDKWKERYNSIKVIHQNNMGVAAARNAGIECSKGNYIGFIDADDIVSKEMYTDLYTQLKINDADFSYGLIERIYGNQKDNELTGEVHIIEGVNIVNAHFGIGKKPHIGKSVCDKLFKRTLIDDIRFREGVLQGEDNLFLTQLLVKCNKCIFLSKVVYYYRDERQGNSSSKGIVKDGIFIDRVLVKKDILKLLIENNLRCAYEKEAVTFYKELLRYDKEISCSNLKKKEKNNYLKTIKIIVFKEKEEIVSSFRYEYSDYKFIAKFILYFYFHIIYRLFVKINYLFQS